MDEQQAETVETNENPENSADQKQVESSDTGASEETAAPEPEETESPEQQAEEPAGTTEETDAPQQTESEAATGDSEAVSTDVVSGGSGSEEAAQIDLTKTNDLLQHLVDYVDTQQLLYTTEVIESDMQVQHNITLGDLLVTTVVAALLIFQVIERFARR